eukprot:GFYU01002552.1.p1 GENE.GFYU01002552.1~~GFYU01002552.1.p1  ORF type:complete len:870 (-),score=194.79 GFYU01002552.1:35-2644(-)
MSSKSLNRSSRLGPEHRVLRPPPQKQLPNSLTLGVEALSRSEPVGTRNATRPLGFNLTGTAFERKPEERKGLKKQWASPASTSPKVTATPSVPSSRYLRRMRSLNDLGNNTTSNTLDVDKRSPVGHGGMKLHRAKSSASLVSTPKLFYTKEQYDAAAAATNPTEGTTSPSTRQTVRAVTPMLRSRTLSSLVAPLPGSPSSPAPTTNNTVNSEGQQPVVKELPSTRLMATRRDNHILNSARLSLGYLVSGGERFDDSIKAQTTATSTPVVQPVSDAGTSAIGVEEVRERSPVARERSPVASPISIPQINSVPRRTQPMDGGNTERAMLSLADEMLQRREHDMSQSASFDDVSEFVDDVTDTSFDDDVTDAGAQGMTITHQMDMDKREEGSDAGSDSTSHVGIRYDDSNNGVEVTYGEPHRKPADTVTKREKMATAALALPKIEGDILERVILLMIQVKRYRDMEIDEGKIHQYISLPDDLYFDIARKMAVAADYMDIAPLVQKIGNFVGKVAPLEFFERELDTLPFNVLRASLTGVPPAVLFQMELQLRDTSWLRRSETWRGHLVRYLRNRAKSFEYDDNGLFDIIMDKEFWAPALDSVKIQNVEKPQDFPHYLRLLDDMIAWLSDAQALDDSEKELPAEDIAKAKELGKVSIVFPVQTIFQCDAGELIVHSLVNSAVLGYLECLDLTMCTGPSTEDIKFLLGQASSLKFLSLGGLTEVTDGILSVLSNSCSVLEVLDLSGCVQITDMGVKHLLKLSSLKKLNFRNCRLLTDDSARAVGEALDLEDLSFHGCPKITDRGVIGVAQMKKTLKRFNSCGCFKISDGARRYLFDTNPSLLVYNNGDDFNTERSNYTRMLEMEKRQSQTQLDES